MRIETNKNRPDLFGIPRIATMKAILCVWALAASLLMLGCKNDSRPPAVGAKSSSPFEENIKLRLSLGALAEGTACRLIVSTEGRLVAYELFNEDSGQKLRVNEIKNGGRLATQKKNVTAAAASAIFQKIDDARIWNYPEEDPAVSIAKVYLFEARRGDEYVKITRSGDGDRLFLALDFEFYALLTGRTQGVGADQFIKSPPSPPAPR
jgi:hypothetical protein